MKLVHSLWSKPLLETANPVERNRKIITTLWCYASSVAYAKKNRLPIRLYADDFGKQLLSFLPYDEILPLTVPEFVPSCFWAAGKFSAYAEMKKGDLHIDGDVFLQSSACVELLKAACKKYDVVVQCIENSSNCISEFYDMANNLLNAFGVTYNSQEFTPFVGAFNTGIIGFNDMALRDSYVRSYLRTIEQVADKPDLIGLFKATHSIPDVVLEQQKLYELSEDKKVFSLLGSGATSYEYSRVIGYMHILSDAKWECLDKIIGQLSMVSPEIFTKTAGVLNKLLFQTKK
jgi:hypothetical protein